MRDIKVDEKWSVQCSEDGTPEFIAEEINGGRVVRSLDPTSAALAKALIESRAETRAVRILWSGAVGLLSQISVRVTDEFEQDSLDLCVADWCASSGWSWNRVWDRVDLIAPEGE